MAGQRVTAAIMFSAGAAPNPGANGNDAVIVEVSTKRVRRFISGGDLEAMHCAVLPLTVPVGTTVLITGVLQDTFARGGPADPTEVRAPTESSANAIPFSPLFDVEGYSTGLGILASEFDPTLPANMIAGTAYGFAWYDSDVDGRPGPYSYTVTGCGNKSCSTKINDFNQLTPVLAGAPCTVLAPMSPM